MNQIISFVIPAYNAKKYLHKCLDSFLDTGVSEQIEVIVVNDGSTDETPDIAREYTESYPQIFRLHNQENAGHGGAINSGVKLAQGKYLKVLDADDWINKKELPALVKILQDSQAEVVFLPYHTVDMVSGERRKFDLFYEGDGKPCSLETVLEHWREFEHGVTFHGILYRTDFYRTRGIRLIEKTFYEDHEYATIPCCYAKTVLPVSHISLYEYLVGNSEQSVAVENQVKRLSHSEAVIKHMLKYYADHSEMSASAKAYYYKKLEGLILSHYKISCLIQPDRRAGRVQVRKLNRLIYRVMPERKQLLKKKFLLFSVMSILHISTDTYDRILQSELYCRIRKKRR